MTILRPVKLSLNKELRTLELEWTDGHHSSIPLKFLRDACPCAACKGEVLFGKVYKPAPLAVFQEGMYELKNLQTVGQYAIQATWKDGHDTGIYSFEYLLMLEAEIKKASAS
jgi:DUF971 family protein